MVVRYIAVFPTYFPTICGLLYDKSDSGFNYSLQHRGKKRKKGNKKEGGERRVSFLRCENKMQKYKLRCLPFVLNVSFI